MTDPEAAGSAGSTLEQEHKTDVAAAHTNTASEEPNALVDAESESGHEAPAFVAPSFYLRPRDATLKPVTPSDKPMSPLDLEQLEGLVSIINLPFQGPARPAVPCFGLHADVNTHVQRIIRAFLKVRTSYDVLPLSFRLIVFDTALLVKKSLSILIQNGRHLSSHRARRPLLIQSFHRHRIGAIVGLENIHLRRSSDHHRLH